MKINVKDIPEEGLTLDLLEEPSALRESARWGEEEVSISSPVSAHIELSKSEGALSVRGNVKATVGLRCSRCLKDFEELVDTDFSLFYETGKVEEKERELRREDIDTNYLEGDEIDTSEIIMEQISLEAPMKPLCEPSCKGLCPSCGTDLNLGKCDCQATGRVDERFSKLKDFKLK